MDWTDAVWLSRVQFAFTISFHIIFPAFTIGLASWLAVVEALWLKTRHPLYQEIYRHWVKIFAVTFGMGVVSGVVMSYQFGTNWAVFSDRVGNVLGPLLAFEVLTAFFLEASFLGIMLFGWGRVGPRMHFASTVIVAVGTLISAFWILSANSWMHTPQGFRIDAATGLYHPTDWLEIIFNPSLPYRFGHMVMGAYLTTGLFVSGVAAWYLLKRRYTDHAKVMLAMGIGLVALLAPVQALWGDFHGLNTLEHQPQKIAAMEGIWEDEQGASLRLFALPDSAAEANRYEVGIPKLGSFILTHDWDGELKGLKSWSPDERPQAVAVIFWSFRVMVGIGLLMILAGWAGVVLYLRGRLFEPGWFHRLLVGMAPLGFVAILAGWFTTEIGRQPYVVYGYMKTAEAASPLLASSVQISLSALFVVYCIVFGAGTTFIFKLIGQGPKVGDWADADDAYGHSITRSGMLAEIFPGRPEKARAEVKNGTKGKKR